MRSAGCYAAVASSAMEPDLSGKCLRYTDGVWQWVIMVADDTVSEETVERRLVYVPATLPMEEIMRRYAETRKA